MSVISVHDVVRYILRKNSPISAMKLHKLLYYSQAWSLVWDDEPMFKARIEAWAYGPVVPEVYQMHKGEFSISKWPVGNANNLSANQKDSVNIVLEYYGSKSSQWLSDLTHIEDPWRDAREGLRNGERSNKEITKESMAEYYGSIVESDS